MSQPAAPMPDALRTVANPLRWRLLHELTRSDRRVHELTAMLGEPQNLVSYHLRELRDAGLVSSRRSSFDGRDAYYRVDLDRCGDVFRDAAQSLDPGLQLRVVTPDQTSTVLRSSVLFLCTGNSARSQMAEALLVDRSRGSIAAHSAGSHPRSLHPNAIKVMAARGIDISGNVAKHLDRFLNDRFDRVVTLCDRVREVCPEFHNARDIAHWSIPDPSAAGATDDESYHVFEQVAADLEVRIGHLIANLLHSEGALTNVR